MTANELDKLILKKFGFKRSWFGKSPVTLRDRSYPPIGYNTYREIDVQVWKQIEDLGITYGASFPDCDDFSDIKLGLFKIGWWEKEQAGEIPTGTAPSYAVVDGYNPRGEMHDFNLFVPSNGKIYVSDYGMTHDPAGYKLLYARF